MGIITALPTLLIATMSVAGSLIISRLGPRRTVIGGLWLLALGGALRGAGPSIAALIGCTLLMGAGIAVIQPAFPSLVRDWFPRRIALGTAAYANGMLFGETLPPLLTLSLVLPLTGGSWELSLAAWSLPAAVAAVLLTFALRQAERPPNQGPALWWPNWRHALTWQLGLILGGASALYWGMNSFIPDYLTQSHRLSLVGPSLAALNAVQLPASLIIALRPDLVGRRLPFIVSAITLAAAIAGFAFLPGWWAVVMAGILGLVSAVIFVLSLSLPPMLAAPSDVPRLMAAMFTITYSCSFLGPLLGGAAWDASGIPAAVFLPLVAGAAGMLIISTKLDFSRIHGAQT